MLRVLGVNFDVLIQRPRGNEIALEGSVRTEPNNSLLRWREMESSTGAMLR